MSTPSSVRRTATGAIPVAGEESAEPRPIIVVLAVSLAVVLAVSLWAFISPTGAESVLGTVVGAITDWFGWAYILLATVILLFVIYVGVRFRRIRLGADSDRPEFSTFAWASMLFAAGIGTDVMFYAVAGPAANFLAPPVIEGGSVQAARESVVWTLFHYGITGWGMYTLMGIALGYFAHRKGLPLSVRSALYPLVGRRIEGGIGHATDIATVLGTIFGVATSLGIGVVMLNVGLDLMFGIDQGLPAQTGLVVVAVTVATISAVSGVDKGIRILSQLNVLLSALIAAWVLIFGDTTFLLRAAVMNVGDFVTMFPGMTLDTMAWDYPAEWMSLWTLFFWAWWIAWASFVGMFLARISRGRTIGQFVVGTLSIPFAYIVMWVTIFGNATVQRIRDGDAAFGQEAMNVPQNGFYEMLQSYPGAWLLIALATLTGLLFYITSADSGALVMANLSSTLPTTDSDAKPWLRILWAVATGVITIAMLLVGGIVALQYATIVMSVPFAIVMILVMWGLHRALTTEHRQSAAYAMSVRAMTVERGRRGSWRQRLAQQFGSVTQRAASARLDAVVLPALAEVAEELCSRGIASEVHEREDASRGIARAASIAVHAGPETTDFSYEVQVRRGKAPSYGGRMSEADDRTYQLAVVVPGGGVYDVMAYSEEQVAHDVLNHYGAWAETMGVQEPVAQ